MASSPEDSIPPLRGFDSEGEPVSVTIDKPLTDPEEEEFRTPAASELAEEYRLRSRTVKVPVCALGVIRSPLIVGWNRFQTEAECELR